MNAHAGPNVKLQWEDLPAYFPRFPGPGRWLPLLQRHHSLLREAEPRVRVSAVPPEDVVRRQYAESLELWRLALAHAQPESVVDVGSGGGFPGLVVAAVAPATRVLLVEPLRKRAALLEALASALGLPNVTVDARRAEEAGRGEWRDCAGLVVARAVAGLPELLEYTAPFAAPGAVVALAKGSGLAAELVSAGPALEALSCELVAREAMRPEVSATPWVLVVRKLAPTAARYPRRPGIPARRPLAAPATSGSLEQD